MQNNVLDVQAVVLQVAKFGDTKLALEILNALSENAVNLPELETVANCYSMLNESDKAMFYAEKALNMSNEKSMLHYSLISIYRQNAFPEKALKIISEIKNEENKEILSIEEAGCLYELNDKKSSLNVLNNINQEKLSEYHKQKITHLLGSHNLWNGNFRNGLVQTIISDSIVRNIESENQTLFHSRTEIDLPFWEGTSDCKKLIIYAEAGIGDEILNIRFMNHLKEKGIEPVWYGVWHEQAETNRRFGVLDVFKESGFNVIFNLSQLKNPSEYMWTYSQYLPICLGLDPKDLWKGSYLTVSKKDLGKTKKNIGIRWHGAAIPKFRNYPLKKLYEIFKDKEANFYSLQKDEGMDEIKDFPGIIDLSNSLKSFYDTASYINSMDVIITSCTSIAHCAAALGKTTYILVPISAYYPWCHPTEKSPWYGDNVTLLRQKTPRSWDEPIKELSEILDL